MPLAASEVAYLSHHAVVIVVGVVDGGRGGGTLQGFNAQFSYYPLPGQLANMAAPILICDGNTDRWNLMKMDELKKDIK